MVAVNMEDLTVYKVEDLEAGDAFLWQGEAYLKSENLEYRKGNVTLQINCLKAETGELCYIEPDTEIRYFDEAVLVMGYE